MSFPLKSTLIIILLGLNAMAQSTLYENDNPANNSTVAAMVVPPNITRIEGSINYSGDVDYYALQIPANQSIKITPLMTTRKRIVNGGATINPTDYDSCVASNTTTIITSVFNNGVFTYYKKNFINYAGVSNCLSTIFYTEIQVIEYTLADVSLLSSTGSTVLMPDLYSEIEIKAEGFDRTVYIVFSNPISSPIKIGAYFADIVRY